MAKFTKDGKNGGLLVGLTDKGDGKGIAATIENNGKPVILGGAEVIINENSVKSKKKHVFDGKVKTNVEILSEINQEGGGVPIPKEMVPIANEGKMKKGGPVIEFNPNHIPSRRIYEYAKKIKNKHPEIWKLGGNEFGNQAYENLEKVIKRGYWIEEEEPMYIKWRSFVARHKNNFRIAGVVAMLKWIDKVGKGWPYMKDLIEKEINKKNKFKTKPRGNKKMFGGVADGNTEMLNMAILYNDINMPPEQIFYETGYFIGLDGKWRSEIDDSSYRMLFTDTNLLHYYERKSKVKLGNLINHNEFFRIFPEAKNILVYLFDIDEYEVPDEDKEDQNCIAEFIYRKSSPAKFQFYKIDLYIDFKYIKKHGKQRRPYPERSSIELAVLHEMQHIFQNQRGHRRGSSYSEGSEQIARECEQIRLQLSTLSRAVDSDNENEKNALESAYNYLLNNKSILALEAYKDSPGEIEAREAVERFVSKNKTFPKNLDGKKKMSGGGKVKFEKPKEATPEELQRRWDKKEGKAQELANTIQRLRLNVTNDLKSDNEKIFLTALVIAVMDKTGERVGNEVSASNGHFGITGLRKKHIKIDGNKITLDYIGKSGVEHETSFSDEKLSGCLKKAIENAKGYFVFTTSQGFRIKGDRINRYLKDFGISAKDIRGYSANQWVINKLKGLSEIESEEAKRKKQFLKVINAVAAKIGHGKATLRKHYLIPTIESSFVEKAEIVDIKELASYKDGGPIDNSLNKKSYGGVAGADNVPEKTFTDSDGRKRFEINDSTAIFNLPLILNLSKQAIEHKKVIIKHLIDILPEWEGYDHYKDMVSIEVIFSINDPDTFLYSYKPHGDNIYINAKKIYDDGTSRFHKEKEVSTNPANHKQEGVSKNDSTAVGGDATYYDGRTRQSLRKRFFHELQHPIQKREGIKIGPSTPKYIIKCLKRKFAQPEMPDAEFKTWLSEKEGIPYANIEYDFYKNILSEKEALDVEKRTFYSETERKHVRPGIEHHHEPAEHLALGGPVPQRTYIGQIGAEKGVEDKTLLERAKEMSELRIPMEEIRKETGWFVNPFDNMWRYEINDSEMEIVVDLEILRKKAEEFSKQEFLININELIKHDKLFKAYPEIGNIPFLFYWNQNNRKTYGISYYEADNTIVFKFNFYAYERASDKKSNGQHFNSSGDKSRLAYDIISHELQHIIQLREGFSKGSSQLREFRALLKEQGLDAGTITQAERNYYMDRASRRFRMYGGELEANDVKIRREYTDKQRIDLEPLSEITYIEGEDINTNKAIPFNFEKYMDKGDSTSTEKGGIVNKVQTNPNDYKIIGIVDAAWNEHIRVENGKIVTHRRKWHEGRLEQEDWVDSDETNRKIRWVLVMINKDAPEEFYLLSRDGGIRLLNPEAWAKIQKAGLHTYEGVYNMFALLPKQAQIDIVYELAKSDAVGRTHPLNNKFSIDFNPLKVDEDFPYKKIVNVDSKMFASKVNKGKTKLGIDMPIVQSINNGVQILLDDAKQKLSGTVITKDSLNAEIERLQKERHLENSWYKLDTEESKMETGGNITMNRKPQGTPQLLLAKSLEESGTDMEEIKTITGWYIDAGNKDWRYDLSE